MQASTYSTALPFGSIAWTQRLLSAQVQGNDALDAEAGGGPDLALDEEAPVSTRRLALAAGVEWSIDQAELVQGAPPWAAAHGIEDELVSRWRAGERAAGDELVRLCTPLLRSFFRRRTTHNVDELMQRTLVACIHAIDRFEGRSTFRSFLLGIAHKQLMMSVRGSRRQHVALQSEASGDDNPSQLLSNKEDVRSVAMALNETSPQFRRVLELFYWDDLSVEEIAQLLGLPAGTVKSRLARGRSMIKARIVEAASTTSKTPRFRGAVPLPASVSLLRDRMIDSRSIPTHEENEKNDSAAIHPPNVSDRRTRSSFCTVHGVRGGGRIEGRTRLPGHLQERPGAGAVRPTG
jgi:RNA polymerase sigma factor (sigma-70 family)